MQGCYRIGIQPKIKKDGSLPEVSYFDEPQLKIVKKKKVKNGEKETGGVAYAQPPEKTIG